MRIILVGLLAVISSALFSQTNFRFADSTAVWNELESQYSWSNVTYSNYHYHVVSDTLVNGLLYQKIAETGTNNLVLLRMDSVKQVFRIAAGDTAEKKIYDFNRHVGDTFVFDGTWQSTYARVDSIDSLQLDRPRKRMFLSTGKSLGSFWSNDIWVEGIGSLITYLWSSGIGQQAVDGPEFNLLCFWENNTQVYQNGFYGVCNYTSISELNELPVTVFYNAGSVTITSDINFVQLSNFSVYDVTGRLILQRPLGGTTTHIDLEGVSKGVYLFHIASPAGKIKSGKLAVQ